MAIPPLERDDLIRAVWAYKEAGFVKAEAARLLGLSRQTYCHQLATARKQGVKPIGGWPDEQQAVAPAKSDGLRVFVIGDAHDCPSLPDKERFFRLGRCARNWGADRVVWIGDVLDMSSLCGHIPDETLKGRLKPSFIRDIESGQEALGEFRRGLQRDIPQDVVEGNHEGARVDRWENENPNAEGLYRGALDRLWQTNGITNHRFGVPLFIGGVCFVHIPLNGMGKPYRGKTASQAIGRDSLCDVVRGDTHRSGVHTEPKLFNRFVRVIDAGTAMPEGYVPSYARETASCWWYGALRLTIANGHVTGWQHYAMHEVMEET